jgi:hypothetical protein
MKQSGFFDVEERLARLSGLGDQLEAFSRTVDFEAFRPDLDKALAYSDGSKGGRPRRPVGRPSQFMDGSNHTVRHPRFFSAAL